MTNHRNRFPARRRFLKQSAALSAGAATLVAPAIIAQTLADPAAADGEAPVDPAAVHAPVAPRGEPSKDSLHPPGPGRSPSPTGATNRVNRR